MPNGDAPDKPPIIGIDFKLGLTKLANCFEVALDSNRAWRDFG